MEYWDLYDKDRKALNRTHARGDAFAEGEYYVCAEIWVRNTEGEFLVTKRHPNKKAGNLWEFVGGGTLSGESTLQSAVRELQEETGIAADESDMKLFATYQRKNYFLDLFLLCKDVDITDLRLQEGEVIDAKWASAEEIHRMIERGEFVQGAADRFQKFKEIVMVKN